MTIENICEAARMEVGLSGSDAKALVDRADDLSRTVAAMGEAIRAADIVSGGERLDAILSRPDVVGERGRWIPIEHYRNVYADRDAAIARAETAEKERDAAYKADAETLTRADAAERSRDELGIQLAACQERLRLAMAVVDAARVWSTTLNGDVTHVVRATVEALAALDAVPGDALPHPTRHLEASGIDTERVK